MARNIDTLNLSIQMATISILSYEVFASFTFAFKNFAIFYFERSELFENEFDDIRKQLGYPNFG